MAKTLLLEAEIREQVGSKSAAGLRKQGRVPAVVYGHKKEPTAISLNAHDFVEGLHHGRRLMDIQMGDRQEKVLVKELQYGPLGKDVIHADLLIVDVTERVQVAVRLEFKGQPKGAEEGGILETHTDSLEVECLVTNIPEVLLVSVKEMEIGDALHAQDVELPAGVKLISGPEILLATCRVVTEEVAEEVEVEEELAELEVISEAKEEAVEAAPAEKKKAEETEKKNEEK
ncbi:50S ribosomal protein L25 [Planctomycetota bacterium]